MSANWKQNSEDIINDNLNELINRVNVLEAKLDAQIARTNYNYLDVDNLDSQDSSIMNLQTNELNATNIVSDSVSTIELSFNDLDDDSINSIIKAIYPIGSIYLTETELSGTKTIENSNYYVEHWGCKWQFLYDTDKRFLVMGEEPTNANVWTPSTQAGTTGGNNTHTHTYTTTSGDTALTMKQIPQHNHTYAARFCGAMWNTSMNRGIGLYDYQTGQYIDSSSTGDLVMIENIDNCSCPDIATYTKSRTITGFSFRARTTNSGGHNSTASGTGDAHNHTVSGTTDTSSNIPQYRVVYVYKRVL